MTRFLRSLLALISVIAFMAATTVQAMPAPQEPSATAEMGDCPMQAAHAKPAKKHCDGLSLDCVKQLGCIGVASLPPVPAARWTPFAWTEILWTALSPTLSGVEPEPSQPPPIA